MLEIRPVCENCGKALPCDSREAMICTFECTFCKHCVDDVLSNVCPNCGGGFEKRPVRPSRHLTKYPAATNQLIKPIDIEKFKELADKYKGIDPHLR
jgi:hypothetical protein